MRKIKAIMKLGGAVGSWVNDYGEPVPPPEFCVGLRTSLRIDLRSSDADDTTGYLKPISIEDFSSGCYYIALDGDFLQDTDPKLLKTSGITLTQESDGKVYLDCGFPNTAIESLLNAVSGGSGVSLMGEIGGYDAEKSPSEAEWAIQFNVVIRNRIWMGGEVPESVEDDPEYLTASQVRALIEEATRPPKGDTGDSAYEIAVNGGYVGSEEEWLASLKGEDGDSAYEIAVAGGYTGTESEWISSIIGESGKSAYEIAVESGYVGSEAEWLASLKGEDGNDGDDGKDLKIDATGDADELSSYGDAESGFVFASSEVDDEKHQTTLMIWVKKTSDYNDWCDPITIRYYEKVANVEPLAPITFSAPSGNAEYFSFSMKDYPNATVASVVINTEDGELTLPLGSAMGIRKILKSDGTVRIYFGSQVPAYESGKVYLTQWLGLSGEGESEISGTSPMYYGYINDGNTFRVSDVTDEILAESSTTITSSDSGVLGRTSLGVVPAGAVIVVLVPKYSHLKSTKDDGFGGRVAFAANNAGTATGENGAEITLNGVTYLAYGEFALLSGETFIYIESEE